MGDLRVLLCDDDPDLLGLLTRRLEKMGFEHDVAADGRLAISLVEKTAYDVIVTDIYMPEATGLEVLQFAKQRDPDVQVVIITSSATLDNAIDALNHGAFGYLTKPFDHLIVFDNMVSRAAEYRHLLVANKHKAEAQKRRGDMLEDEVAQRVQQIQKKQKGLLDLLGSLPDGILVVEEGGKVVLSSPVGERWLARDTKAEQQPIHKFISQVNAPAGERSGKARIEDRDLQLIALDFPAEANLRRKAVIIREIESDGLGAGSLVTETVMGIKKGLAALYKQGVGTEAVLNLANQFAVLEQLAGWTAGEAGIAPSPPSIQAVPEPIGNDDLRGSPPVEEPKGPRLNTSELEEALRAAGVVEAQPPRPEPTARPVAVPEPLSEPVPDLAGHGFPLDEAEPEASASATIDLALSEPLPAAEPSSPTTQPEPSFPKTDPSVLDPAVKPIDTGLFRPRIIPEAMSAKLGEPPPIQPSNVKRRLLRIGSSAADTQIFRRVLEKMSGETVIGPGEQEPEAAVTVDKPRPEARAVPPATAEELEPTPDPVSALRQLAIAAEPELVVEAPPEPRVPPKRKPKPQGPEPKAASSKPNPPKPAPSKPTPPDSAGFKAAAAKRAAPSWPPTLPSNDPEWDDSLETKS